MHNTKSAEAAVQRISATQVDREMECGHRAQKERTGEWPRLSTVAQMRGTAVHAAREASVLAYKRTGSLLPVPEAVDAAKAKIEERAAREAIIDGSTADALADAAPFISADRTLMESIAPHIDSIEERLEAPLSDGSILSAGLDLLVRDPVARRLTVADLKTGTKRPSQADVNASTQLTVQGILVRQVKGEAPGFVIDAMRVLKRKPTAVEPTTVVVPFDGGYVVSDRLTTERGEADYAATLKRIALVLDRRARGEYPPAALGIASACSRCPHRGHADPALRCEWVSAYRGNEITTEDA